MRLMVKHFNVGQGGCSLIKVVTHEGRKLFSCIYDCGSITAKKKVNKERILKEVLDFNGDNIINMVVLSHLDKDHINWAYDLLNSIDKSKVRLVVPYLSKEMLLLFLHSDRRGKYFSEIRNFLSIAYPNAFDFNSDSEQGKVMEIHYGIGSSSHLDDMGEHDNFEEFSETGEDYTLTFYLLLTKVDGQDIRSLQKIVVKDKSSCCWINISLFQPHYNKKKFEDLAKYAKHHVGQDCNDLNSALSSIKKKHRGIHKDLNETCVGLFVHKYVKKYKKQEVKCKVCCERGIVKSYDVIKNLDTQLDCFKIFDAYIFLGDMKINSSTLDYEILSDVSCCKLFKTSLKDILVNFGLISFQLPHHGSKYSIEKSDLKFLRYVDKIFLFHGKDRKHHPNQSLIKEISKIATINAITE